jgi:ribosomal protein S18 acetylase RimI-like enzyme
VTSAAARVRIRIAAPADAARIAAFGAQGFHDTFAVDNRPEDMAAYLAETFGEPQQLAELRDPRSTYLIAEREVDAGHAEMVGYARVLASETPACVPTTPAVEIARLYARRDVIGQGVGSALITACLAHARALGARAVWLGVWEHNARAIAFYERWGFEDVGAYPFVLGADVQTDRIMARPLE